MDHIPRRATAILAASYDEATSQTRASPTARATSGQSRVRPSPELRGRYLLVPRATRGLVPRDEGLRGRVERGRRVLVRDVVDHVLREVLAELDAPLVEGVDAPDEALDRAPVLVEREERADVVGVELREEEAEGRAVAGEGAVGAELEVPGVAEEMGRRLARPPKACSRKEPMKRDLPTLAAPRMKVSRPALSLIHI